MGHGARKWYQTDREGISFKSAITTTLNIVRYRRSNGARFQTSDLRVIITSTIIFYHIRICRPFKKRKFTFPPRKIRRAARHRPPRLAARLAALLRQPLLHLRLPRARRHCVQGRGRGSSGSPLEFWTSMGGLGGKPANGPQGWWAG